MSIRKEDIDIENPLNNLKYLLLCFLKYRLLWNAGKENWKNKEHIARLTAFYSKYQPSKVFSIISCYFQINSITKLLAKYEGRELEMYNNIYTKYGVDALSPSDRMLKQLV